MLGVTRFYDDDTAINAVVAQLLLRCDKVTVMLTGSCSEESLISSLRNRVEFVRDMRPWVSNSESLQRVLEYANSQNGALPNYLVYPDQDEILPVQWPKYIDFLDKRKSKLGILFGYLTCWNNTTAVLPLKYAMPRRFHCKILRLHSGLNFLLYRRYYTPNVSYKTLVKSVWPIRHTCMMLPKQQENFYKRVWRHRSKRKFKAEKIINKLLTKNEMPKVLQFSDNKQWRQYELE